MSLSDHQTGDPLTAAAARVEFVPSNFFQRLDLADLFPRAAPLEVDIGCGEGAFLFAMAAEHPERNFLGIERLVGRVSTVCRVAAHRRLENIRVMRVESAYVLTHLLPLESVAVAHVLFPDPWPKRYHHPRRLIQAEFMQSLHGVLAPGGGVARRRRMTSRISNGWKKCSRRRPASSGSTGRTIWRTR